MHTASIQKVVPVASGDVLRLPHLRAWRERKGLTLRELAALAGVDKMTLQGLETKEREARASTRRKIAAALGITHEELLDGPPCRS